MQNTTNYNMNLVEGTDIVNVPVQLNPNFQTIDSEMFKNKQSGIGTATEVVTGTVHAVVRNNTDADVFRFTATGAWASGDTMTLDGSAVTVHMADGTAPSAGAYIIGAEVVAVVNGSLVTLLTSNGAIDPGVTSFNSRTGAVSPAASDYDASMIDYDNTVSGLLSTDSQGAIDELAAKVGAKVLWTNPDPSAATFASQPMSLSSSDYEYLMFIGFIGTWGGYYRSCSTIIKKGMDADLFVVQTRSDSSGIGAHERKFDRVSDTSYTAQSSTSAIAGTAQTQTDNLIPLYVLGF